MIALNTLALGGYKSVKQCPELRFRQLNVLIGANGSGKSNLLSFFKLLNYAMTGALQIFIGRAGGARSLLHYGPKTTPQCSATMTFQTDAGQNTYHCRLFHAAPDTLIFGEESIRFQRRDDGTQRGPLMLGAGQKESAILMPEYAANPTAKFFRNALPRFRAYQFHDTSNESRLRGRAGVDDNRFLYSDAGNLPSVLNLIREQYPHEYQRILEAIRLVAPFFHDFQLQPLPENPRQVMLNWRANNSEYELGPHQISDGTLRFMALTTLLLQPRDFLPAMIIIDEPELGLHPYAIKLLASMLKDTSNFTQILVATQSSTLVDLIEPEDVIVANIEDGSSMFQRLGDEQLREWLSEYSLGQLWEKNIIGGRP
jgi:predicted ATPase